MLANYFLAFFVNVCLHASLAYALNISFGMLGLMNLGHVALFAAGAYSFALSLSFGGSLVLSFLLTFVSSLLFSSFLALLTLRLRSDFYAIASLALHYFFLSLILNERELTGGIGGVALVNLPLALSKLESLALVSSVTLFLCFSLNLSFAKGRYGRAARAAFDFESGAESLGLQILQIRWLMLLGSALLVALTAVLYCSYLSFINPTSFNLELLILLLLIVLAAGPGSVYSVLWVTPLLLLIPDLLSPLELSSRLEAPIANAFFALCLLLITLQRKDSLFPKERRV